MLEMHKFRHLYSKTVVKCAQIVHSNTDLPQFNTKTSEFAYLSANFSYSGR